MTRQPTGPDAGADDGDPPVAAPGQDNGQLSRSVILQTALAIVDRDGVDRLSMRRLSNALGRDPVMLYRHVPNKAAVLDGVAEIVLAQLVGGHRRPGLGRPTAHRRARLPPVGPGPPQRGAAAGHSTVGHPARAAATGNAAATGRRPRPAHLRRVHRRRRPAHLPDAVRLTCTATSSTSCRRSSSDPRKPTTYCGSVCTGSRSPNSPYCVRWHPPWPPTTAPPNSTASSICCSPA